LHGKGQVKFSDTLYTYYETLITFFSPYSLESSHSISTVVNDPNEINSLFDSISYDKVQNKFFKLFLLNYFSITTISQGIKHYKNDEFIFNY